MEIMCAGPTHRESEFALVGGVRTFGTCGPCALATALTNSLRMDAAPLHTSDLYSKMAAAGELMAVLPSPNAGMSNAGQWLATARLYQADVTAFRDYGGDVWADWAAFLSQHAGHSPTVLMVARNYLIRDEISGLGQNANTDPNDPAHSLYHIFCVYGRHDGGYSARAGRVLPPGYWCADGCNYAGGNDRAHNFQAADVLQFYADATMAAAMPCAALALAGRGSITTMGADPTPFFTVSADGQTYTDTRTKEVLYKGAFDALVKAGDTRPVISGTKLLAGAGATTSRFIVGSLDSGTAVYIGDGPPDTFTVGFPGNALLHVEAALAAARSAPTPPAPTDPTAQRNAALGGMFLDMLTQAGVKL